MIHSSFIYKNVLGCLSLFQARIKYMDHKSRFMVPYLFLMIPNKLYIILLVLSSKKSQPKMSEKLKVFFNLNKSSMKA